MSALDMFTPIPLAFTKKNVEQLVMLWMREELNYYRLKAVGLWAKLVSPNKFSETAQ
ncbi:MAG: hypothetical protein QME78_03975 [Thermodesulfobacteriota bacterium]|nr:hypothetical protein [Thermodesulfobacteriota bacterium]